MEDGRKIFNGVRAVVIALAVIALICVAFSSCNVTRTVTTTAQTVQKGDTTVVIMTKTIETYDGNVDAMKILQAGQAAGL